MSNKCDSCRYNSLEWYEEPCDSCCGAHSGYEPIDEEKERAKDD